MYVVEYGAKWSLIESETRSWAYEEEIVDTQRKCRSTYILGVYRHPMREGLMDRDILSPKDYINYKNAPNKFYLGDIYFVPLFRQD